MHYLSAIEAGPIMIGAIAVIVLGIIAYFVIRMMKGKVEIELPKRGYNPGEQISRSVNLISRKELKMNRFYVALIGYELIERTDSDGNRKTRKNEIYRYEHNLAEAGSLRAGHNQRFEFSIVAPGGEDTEEVSELSKILLEGSKRRLR